MCMTAKEITEQVLSQIENIINSSLLENDGSVKISNITEKLLSSIDKSLGISETLCSSLMTLYIAKRADLCTSKGLVFFEDKKVNKLMTAEECALRFYHDFMAAGGPSIIEGHLAGAEALPSNKGKRVSIKLREVVSELAQKINVKEYNMYYCVKKYIKESDTLCLRRGSSGGISRI